MLPYEGFTNTVTSVGTVLKVIGCCHHWKVVNFNYLDLLEAGEELESGPFSATGYQKVKWNLILRKSETNEDEFLFGVRLSRSPHETLILRYHVYDSVAAESMNHYDETKSLASKIERIKVKEEAMITLSKSDLVEYDNYIVIKCDLKFRVVRDQPTRKK